MTKTLDFMDRLLDEMDTWSLDLPLKAYSHNTDESIVITSMPGGRTMSEDMNGTKDKRFTYFCEIKVNNNKIPIAEQLLQSITLNLDNLIDVPSHNKSYEFIDVVITNEPYHTASTDDGKVYFRMSFQVELTILGGN